MNAERQDRSIPPIQGRQQWRPPRELDSQLGEIHLILGFKRSLADLMLFMVMSSAQANRPFVRWFNAEAAVCPASDVGAFDR